MRPEVQTPTAAALLTPPEVFEREQNMAFLFAPHSPKLARRVYLYTPPAYDLWALVESDSDVLRFNERPPRVPIATLDGGALTVPPRFVTQHADKSCHVHSWDMTEADVAENEQSQKVKYPSKEAWAAWCETYKFKHTHWEPDTLKANPVHLDNLKRLLRFTTSPNRVRSVDARDAIKAVLQGVRKMRWHSLVTEIARHDPQVVKEEICRLILDNTVYSDLDKFPLSLITVLSIHAHGLSEA